MTDSPAAAKARAAHAKPGAASRPLAVIVVAELLGTSLWFENDRVRVFEVRLEPGERGPFHVHDRTYFWTVVEPGRGRQRFADGTFVVRDEQLVPGVAPGRPIRARRP